MLSNSVALGSASQMINALSQKDPVKLGSESEKKLSLSPIFGNIFDQHSKTIHRCFGPGRTEATVACLSFLIVCISCDGGSCAQIVLNSLRWDHKTVARLLSTRSPSSSNSTTKPVMNPTLYYVPEIRSLMIRLIFTAISTTDLRPSVKLDFWRTKGLAYGVLKGLQKDSYCSLAFILDRLWQGVVVKEGWNARWGSKSAFEGTDYHSRWEIFDRTTLTMLIQLLDREDVHSSLKSEGSTPEEAGELMERFLTNLIIYVAKLAPTNVFQSQANLRFSHYRLLSNLIRVCAPTKSLRRQRLALHALQLNPSLFGTLWRHSAPPTEVSPTISWISSVGFATKVITIPVTIPVIPLNFDTVDREKHNLIKTSAEDLITLCIPSPLTRLWLTKTLQHSNALISFTALGMLVACLKKAIDISSQLRKVIRKRGNDIGALQNLSLELQDISHSIKPWSGILAAFSLGLQAILPVPQVLVAALQTALRRAQESKLTSTLPAETNLEPSNFTSFSSAADSDIVSFQLLSALGLYQELFPKLMCNVGFDYAKLVPIFLKVKVTDDYCEPSVDETLTRKVNSAVFYLCQSQVLKLISHSASSIPPSQTLIKFLLSLSSTPHACKPLEGLYTPYPIKKAAIEALEAITKYNVPQLESVYESHELVIWIDCLTELRGVGEDKWHLMIFLEDCIRALLRDPLKFVQATQESFKLNPLSTYGVKVPLLLISFLLKLSAVVKALSCDPTNEKRINTFPYLDKSNPDHVLLATRYANLLVSSAAESFSGLRDEKILPDFLMALKNLSQLSNGEGIVDLILLLSNNLGHLQSLSDDDDGRLLSVWEDLGKEILGTGPDKLNLADKTLRIVANLIKKSPEMLIAALEWLSKSSLKTLCSSLWGSSYLLAACLQVSNLKDSHSDHNSSRFKEILDRDRVKAFLSELLSSAFPDKISNSQSGSKQLREQRSSAQNALEQVFYSEFDLDLNQLFLRLARVTESNLVYAEALSVMCTTQSSQLKSYIEKCLRWLVRRFAEDDSISLETEELSLSLSKCLGRKGHQILLPVHLVNPVVSVALERWLNVGFVMKLINQLIRSTKLEDSEALKHLRAVVERRKFRTIMESFDDDQQDVSVISVLKSLVLACPLAAVQVNISSLLIPFYGGTVSMRDTLIFQILRIEDLWSTNSQLYQTILEWKPRRLSRKAIRGSDPFAFLDSDRLDATCIWILSETSKAQHSLYDPTFLLMFFLQFSEHEKISISIWNSVAGVGLLGMMMCGLSSSNKTWRVLSDRCLAKSYELLKDLNHADASEILLPLEHFRRLHGANRLKAVSNAVPPLITLFLARCSKVLSAAPGSELCPLLSRFLLQRAIVDARDVPMLYGLLYSTTDRPIKNRVWLMELLRDGFNSTIDWKIMDQRQTIEILSTLVLLSSRDESDLLRPLFLQILERLCSHNQPFIKTFTKSSMAMVLREIQPRSKSEYEEMVKILFKAVSRLPLLPRMVSSEVTKDILIIIESLTEAINQSFLLRLLPIVRSLLVAARSSWLMDQSGSAQLESLRKLFDRIVNRINFKNHDADPIVHEIKARFRFLTVYK
ncbi:hypothetical protein PPACK8108_LOCUS25900 [Phakopsora pachyrhizi]|uniref:Nucleolar pre-ribosomal-associated protein 1 C-terminal domain-containing protein n=1 Tax=Phakopsora pachyrhizi TaxID=170000 RepID=A0AAV0BVM0_PHAPC|nr:hypothetical protein PPACK8108_LOCUS25900 [Phakopsora pachyrhizi]